MKVLYVEDDLRDTDLVVRAMAKRAPHIGIDNVTSIEEARKRLEGTRQYDLVLADLHLPDGTGLDLLREIRTREIPIAVVILTGHGDEETVVSVIKAGADDYLPKRPGFTDLLPQTLEDAFNRFDIVRALRVRPLRVLYAEHDTADIDLTSRHIKNFARHIKLEIAASGKEALERLPASKEEPCPWDVFLLDYRLPGENSFDVLKTIRIERQLDLPVILVTGQGDEDIAAQAMRLGAADYIVKNSNYLHRLPALIESAYSSASIKREKAALKESEKRYRELFEGMLLSLGKLTEVRDPYTSGHQQRVADLATAIAGKMELEPDRIEGINAAGILHDIGKLTIPAEILTKPATLNELEYRLVKLHPQTGYDILKEIKFPWPLPEMVLQHHERLDGSGYPQGLSGEDIMLEARILAVADVFEAMSSFRPYRAALGMAEALDEIQSGSGILYDEKVVAACVELIEDGFDLDKMNE
ncbi:MAG: HD domain-containing phosphohydrolase [Thermovirgaceae bacterium]